MKVGKTFIKLGRRMVNATGVEIVLLIDLVDKDRLVSGHQNTCCNCIYFILSEMVHSTCTCLSVLRIR